METWPIGATFPVALEVGPSLFTLTTTLLYGLKRSPFSFPESQAQVWFKTRAGQAENLDQKNKQNKL